MEKGMMDHIFAVGQKLFVKPGMLTSRDAAAVYEVVRLLPPLGESVNQYRIKKVSDAQEFVVRESELTAA